MIKTLILYTDIDDLVVNCFVGGVAVFVLLYWFVKKLKSPTDTLTFKPIDSNSEFELDNYTLNFNTEMPLVKTTSLVSKITLSVVSLIVVITPFYEFVETLRPREYYVPFTCFPGLVI